MRCHLSDLRRPTIAGFNVLLWLGVFFSTASQPISGAITEAWVQRYASPVGHAEDYAARIVRDVAGDIIVIGSSYTGNTATDIVTVKYSGRDGSVIWQRRHDGPANSHDGPGALAVDPAGNIIMAGSSSGVGSGGDFYTAKYAAADGALLWERRYNGPGNYNDSPRDVAADSDGNVVVTGTSASGPGYVFYTAKYAAADGALLWEKQYSGLSNFDDGANAVGIDGQGNVIVTGSSEGGSYTVKYASADGAVLWERRSNGGGSALAVDRNGDVVVTGQIGGGQFVSPDFYTVKYAGTDGALLWERRYNGPANAYDLSEGLVLDPSGNAIVTGRSFGRGSSFDYYTAKYAAANGALLWEQRANGAGNDSDFPYAIAVDARGDVAVTGSSWNNASRFDIHTVKYAAADGAMIWERYDGSTHENDDGLAVVLDDGGNVIVAGNSPGAGGSIDIYTARFAAANGALLWEKHYDGPSNPLDTARAVALDSSGNVIVTGNSSADLGKPDYLASTDAYTIKYAASDGGVIWARRYNGPGDANDGANAVAVDGSGNVVVTGSTAGSEGSADFYTAKYAADDGALLWEKRYDGPEQRQDQGDFVAVDGAGNVIAMGQSYIRGSDGEGSPDFYTAKYAGADGALLWERRFDGLGNYSDYPAGMALDRHGNVVVTGHSYNADLDSEFYTAKYAGADGALLWERRYNGPTAYGFDSANGVAVDARGNVIVTGFSQPGFPRSESDFYTAKYASADGALLWEILYDGPAGADDQALAVAVDRDGNAIVTGYSHGSGGAQEIYTAKYRAADGHLLWERRYGGAGGFGENVGNAVAVDGAGNAVVTGYSSNGTNRDYYTAKYAAADGALLWEQRYNSPSNRTDYPAPLGLAVGANGKVVVTGYSDHDFATVVYQDTVAVPGARGIKQSVLAELATLRATVTDRDAARALDQAIAHLTHSLSAEFWEDESHLERRHGDRVFREEKEAVRKLCDLIRSRQDGLSDAVLQGFIDRLIEADRLLASVAIEEALAAGVSERKIEQAEKFLARGDGDAEDDKCGNGIEDYRNAWKRAARAKVSPPVRLANGRVRLEVAAEPGERFTIQASSNLKDWVTLGTATANAEGMATIEDTAAGQQGTRFYRAVER